MWALLDTGAPHAVFGRDLAHRWELDYAVVSDPYTQRLWDGAESRRRIVVLREVELGAAIEERVLATAVDHRTNFLALGMDVLLRHGGACFAWTDGTLHLGRRGSCSHGVEPFEAGQPLESKLLMDLKERRVALQAQLEALDSRFDNEQALLDSAYSASENEILKLRIETQALDARLAIAERQRDMGLRLAETDALAESDAMLLDDRVQSRRAALASNHQVLERVQSSLRALPLHSHPPNLFVGS